MRASHLAQRAGSRIVVDHKHIKGPLFIFSALESVKFLRNKPSILSTPQKSTINAVLDRFDAPKILSHATSP
jgi:hypothetical protein